MKDFAETFRQTIDEIHRDAADLGVSMSRVCGSAGVAEPTPRTYRRHLPTTVRTVVKLQNEIERRRALRAVSDAA
jgi:hypothetical protein